MIAEFTRGAGYVLRGFKLIRTPRIRRFVIIPLLVNLVLFAGLIAYGINEFTQLTEWLLSFLPEWLAWLKWLLWPVFALTAMLFVFYLFTPIANLIGAPFNSLLAEKLEIHLSGNQPASDQAWSQLITELPKTLISEFKKLRIPDNLYHPPVDTFNDTRLKPARSFCLVYFWRLDVGVGILRLSYG